MRTRIRGSRCFARSILAAACLLGLSHAGCRDAADQAPQQNTVSKRSAAGGQAKAKDVRRVPLPRQRASMKPQVEVASPSVGQFAAPIGTGNASMPTRGASRRSDEISAHWTPPQIDEQRMQAAGFVRYAGRHVTLYTDLPQGSAIEELPAVFDKAVPQWCDYFGVEAARAASWHLFAYLMQDPQRFRNAGVLPDDLPRFLNGYQRKTELWLYEQPADYYRRHLLLHEGTHAFMQWALGAAGPPWFMEGIAELLATHCWRDGQLTLHYFPQNREEVPHWGRIKIIKDDLATGRGKSLEDVLDYDAQAHLTVEPYAWCWAVATMFDHHPATRPKFREMCHFTTEASGQFNERFLSGLAAQWPLLVRQWQVFVFNMEYGYDLSRELMAPQPVRSLPDEGAVATVSADRGWQSSGLRLEAGATYRFDASGRYQVADKPRIWWCEPNGVTICYYRGLPLGMLLAALVDEDQPVSGITTLVQPGALGRQRKSVADRSGTLYLRINESPAQWRDNAGQLTVRITRVPTAEDTREHGLEAPN